jgi:hypothetical protein
MCREAYDAGIKFSRGRKVKHGQWCIQYITILHYHNNMIYHLIMETN